MRVLCLLANAACASFCPHSRSAPIFCTSLGCLSVAPVLCGGLTQSVGTLQGYGGCGRYGLCPCGGQRLESVVCDLGLSGLTALCSGWRSKSTWDNSDTFPAADSEDIEAKISRQLLNPPPTLLLILASPAQLCEWLL